MSSSPAAVTGTTTTAAASLQHHHHSHHHHHHQAFYQYAAGVPGNAAAASAVGTTATELLPHIASPLHHSVSADGPFKHHGGMGGMGGQQQHTPSVYFKQASTNNSTSSLSTSPLSSASTSASSSLSNSSNNSPSTARRFRSSSSSASTITSATLAASGSLHAHHHASSASSASPSSATSPSSSSSHLLRSGGGDTSMGAPTTFHIPHSVSLHGFPNSRSSNAAATGLSSSSSYTSLSGMNQPSSPLSSSLSSSSTVAAATTTTTTTTAATATITAAAASGGSFYLNQLLELQKLLVNQSPRSSTVAYTSALSPRSPSSNPDISDRFSIDEDDVNQMALEQLADSYITNSSSTISPSLSFDGSPACHDDERHGHAHPVSALHNMHPHHFLMLQQQSQQAPHHPLLQHLYQTHHRAHSADSESSTADGMEANAFDNGLETDETDEDTDFIEWQRGDLLGQGAFGKVYRGLLPSGEFIAVKQVELSQEHLGELHALEKEIKLLKGLRHENIVRYINTQMDANNLYILLEYVPGGSLASLLSKFGSLNVEVVSNYTRQILMGLIYLHENGIVHLDIKGANILVDNAGVIKLADFGASGKLAVTMSLNSNSLRGTPYWMAPEVIKQQGYGKSADIWSLGCTVLEMLTGKPPWHKFKDYVAAIFHIASSTEIPDIPESLADDGKDFLWKCFKRNPDERPTAFLLSCHEFVRFKSKTLHRSHSLSNASSRNRVGSVSSPLSLSSSGASSRQASISRSRTGSNADIASGNTASSSSAFASTPTTPTMGSAHSVFTYSPSPASSEEFIPPPKRHSLFSTLDAEEEANNFVLPSKLTAHYGNSSTSSSSSSLKSPLTNRRLRNSYSSPLSGSNNVLAESSSLSATNAGSRSSILSNTDMDDSVVEDVPNTAPVSRIDAARRGSAEKLLDEETSEPLRRILDDDALFTRAERARSWDGGTKSILNMTTRSATRKLSGLQEMRSAPVPAPTSSPLPSSASSASSTMTYLQGHSTEL